MFETQEKIELTLDELAVIKAALHTQIKILSVQSGAGGKAALRRLNEVKRALAHIDHQTDAGLEPKRRGLFSWFGAARASS